MDNPSESTPEPLRPRDFAVLLLSSGDVTPRQRARDQQADRAGLDLKRRVLSALVALDPEATELEAALLAIVEEMGPPTGPTRSIALALFEEWRAASATPACVAHLLSQGVRGQESGVRSQKADRGRPDAPLLPDP
jgi:hypothetical protein